MVLALFLVFSLDLRGIWVPRWSIDDHEAILNTLDGKFNHIFLQIYALGEAYYPSQLAPVRKHDDAWLRRFLAEARRRGIKVSAWLNVFYSWGYAPWTGDLRHPIRVYPNWYVEDRNGRSILSYEVEDLKNQLIEGYYLTPANAQVRRHMFRVIDEILDKYDFDGVHLDYFRYPSRRFIYDTAMRGKFLRRYCVDPVHSGDAEAELRYGAWGVKNLEDRLHELARAELTDFMRALNDHVREQRPHVEVSVAVKADYQSASTDFGQDWPAWVDDDLVHFVCLMAYGRDIESILNKTMRRVNDPRKVAVGVGIYNLSPERIAAQVKQVESLPFAGVVFFSYEELRKNRNYLHALR
ncbi:family 10 glycosylhydrolase [candidate division WOR-3 bacterium]|nr:family 10 glycosylhydrolase [candidate division WOR-3 bacterium]